MKPVNSLFTRTILSVLSFFILANVYSQDVVWSNQITATDNVQQLGTSHIDANGNLMIGGWFIGNLSFVGTTETLSSTSIIAFIAKYNQNGVLLWANQVGETSSTTVKMIKTDHLNNIYVVGEINGISEFTSQNLNNITISNTIGFDGFLAKYDPNGNLIYAINIAYGNGVDRLNSLAIDDMGYIYIGGFFRGSTIVLGSNDLTLNYIGANNWGNGFVAKFKPNISDDGVDFISALQFGTDSDGTSRVSGLEWHNNSIFLALDFKKSIFIEGTSPHVDIVSTTSWQSNAMVKLSDVFDFQWAKVALAKSSDLGTSNNLVVDENGNSYFGGRFGSEIFITNQSGETNEAYYSEQTKGNFDCYISGFSSNGTPLWLRSFGSIGEERLWGLSYSSQVISTAGFFNGELYAKDSLLSASNGGRDGFVVNFDVNGNLLSSRALGNAGDEEIYFSALTSDANGIDGGIFASSTLNIGGTVFTKLGSTNDAFLAKHTNIHILPTITPIINNASAAGSIALQVFGGGDEPYSYTLSKEGVTIESGTYSVPINLTGLNGGVYKFEVIDNSSRQVTKYYHIFEPTISKVNPLDELNYCQGQPVSVALEVNIPKAKAYQWLKDGVAITGEGTTNYTATEAGVYTIQVTIDGQVGISNEIVIHVEELPVTGTLTKTPDLANVCENEPLSVKLTPGSGGIEDVFQYRVYNGTEWSTWIDYISESVIPTSGITDVEVQTYRANMYCPPSSVETVSWQVEPTPVSGTLVKQPDEEYICEGTAVKATFTAGTGGNDIDVVEYTTDGTTWQPYVSETEIETSGVAEVEIRTHRTASYCTSAEYVTVSWQVEATPVSGTLTKQPDEVYICEGTAVKATFTAGAGGNGIDVIEYTTDGTTWLPYVSETEIETSGVAEVEIRARRTASYCTSAEYVTVSWQIEPTPVSGTLVKLPNGEYICEGTAVKATFTAGTGGNTIDEIEYTTDGTNWLPYVSETVIETSGVTEVQIRTRRTASYCTSAEYVIVSWLVNPQTNPGTLSGGSNICEGSNSGMLTLTGYTGLVIRWEKSVVPFDTWTEIVHTQDTYTSNSLPETTRFRAVVKSGVCDAMESNYTEVEVTPVPVAGQITGDNLICAGNGPILTLNGYSGTIVRWKYSKDGSLWQTSGTSDPTYYAPVINQTTQYKVEVDNGVCPSVSTDVFIVDVETNTIGGSVAGSTSICEGETSGELTLTGHLGEVVKWQSSTNSGGTWVDINHTAVTYTSAPLTQTTLFRAMVKNGVCAQVFSGEATITVYPYPEPAISTIANTQICAGSIIDVPLTGSITGAESYQWYHNGNIIPDANGQAHNASQLGIYSVEVTTNGCLGVSNEIEITEISNPVPIISNSTSLNYCEGETISTQLTCDILGANTYQWFKDGVMIDEAKQATYTATAIGGYSLEVTVDGCSGLSNELNLIVNPLPTVTAPADFEACNGESITLTATGDATSYEWSNSVLDGVPFIITQSTTYTVTGTNTTTGCSATDEVVVTVNPIPQPVISTIDNLNICSGDDINVEFTSSIPGAVSQWFKNDVMIDGANQTSYTATEIGTYSLEVTEKGCSGLSNKLDIIELDRPEPIISTNDKVQYDFGETISTLFMVSVNDAESYQWLMNGTPILDANQPTFTATQVGVYSVELLVNGCTGISNTLEIIQSLDFNPVISTTDNLEWCEGQSILVNLWVNIANADKYVWYRNSEIITNASTANIQVEEDGIYKVDVTVNEVTKTSTEIEIVTIPAPNPTISTNDKLVWPEGNPISVTFTADITDAEAYQWLNGATPIPDAISASYEATTVGEYSVLVTKGSCQGQSNVIEVTTAPYFNVTFTVKNTGGEPMSNAEITVENFDPIVTNEAGVAIFISTEGMFNYMVKAQDFNSFEDAFTVNDQDIDVNIVMVPSGISEEGFLSVNLYPNPFKNEIKISDSGLLKRVVITSISGQKVMDINLEGIDRINTQNLPAGVYLLRLYTQSGESKVFRMVKDQ